MRWTPQQLNAFESRRSADGQRTSATVRRKLTKRTPRDATASSELQIHIAVAQHLRHRGAAGLWWVHPPNGEKRDARDGAKLKAMGTRPGTPDLLLLHRGKFFAMELKRHDGRLSPDQVAARDDIESAGGFWACTHSLNAALAVLSAWGLIKPDATAAHSRDQSAMAGAA